MGEGWIEVNRGEDSLHAICSEAGLLIKDPKAEVARHE